jgi:hypothetical protein
VPVGFATAHAFFNMCVSDGANSLVTKAISAIFGLIVGSVLFGIPFYVLRIGASLSDH